MQMEDKKVPFVRRNAVIITQPLSALDELQDAVEVETKLAKAVANCIGITEEGKILDKLRKQLKAQQHKKQPMNAQSISQYEKIISNVKEKVVKKNIEYQELLAKSEKEYFLKHGHVPKCEEYCKIWGTLIKKKKLRHKATSNLEQYRISINVS